MGGALDPTVARGRTAVRAVLPDVGAGDVVVVGVSGGADSLALAACAAFVARRDGWTLQPVVVDHGLQPGSAQVAADAGERLRALGLEPHVVRVRVSGGGGPEAAARDARRAALQEVATELGGVPVLLGHTLDDQAETVLLGLGRGSGARSLSGMARVDGAWRRPFLRLRRSDTERVCTAHGIAWWSDPHNVDPSFTRVRVRRDVMPLLEDVLGGGVAEALARTAEQLRLDNAALDALAEATHDGMLAVGALAVLPAAVRARVLRRAALEAGARADELSATHLAAVDELVTAWRGQRRVELPGHVSVVRDRAATGDRLRFARTPVGG